MIKMLIRFMILIQLRQGLMSNSINPFSTETHFYHEFYVRLDHFIDIMKSLWRSKD
ncbi:hypothetical protein E2C01_020870 [Portunus trituberculatus]|uniref:Uncharacterized protein n=1 Tax=Portunus trituberculatus TaxID=210409 RepID=A0A5B7E126_PORTR|nr:hypothetical protein [Portunus trituberculatus]